MIQNLSIAEKKRKKLFGLDKPCPIDHLPLNCPRLTIGLQLSQSLPKLILLDYCLRPTFLTGASTYIFFKYMVISPKTRFQHLFYNGNYPNFLSKIVYLMLSCLVWHLFYLSMLISTMMNLLSHRNFHPNIESQTTQFVLQLW